MRVGDGELTFPVPWASEPQGSSVDSIAIYQSALKAAGFKILTERNRGDFALKFFAQLKSNAARASNWQNTSFAFCNAHISQASSTTEDKELPNGQIILSG
jgi:hypothetical protein